MEFIKISNRKEWLTTIPKLHPDSTSYINYWKEQKKFCIEGKWGNDFDSYRYMPPFLYFYVNFCKILDFDNLTKTRKNIKPTLTDLMWELAYMIMEAKGFSGYTQDNIYSASTELYLYLKDNKKKKPKNIHCYDKDGNLKQYKSPRELLRELHNTPKGLPLYHNEAKNTFVLGSRGSGKSYFYGLGVFLHALIFDGAKEYTEETKAHPAEIHLNIGSWESNKSAELCSKIESCMNAFAIDPELGVWGDESSDDYEPNPFYKSMNGSLKPNNAGTPWTHQYDKNINGRWLKFGTKSKIVHSIYKDNPTAAAGGRYSEVLIEEAGLHSMLRDTHGSNIATTQKGTLKVGSMHYIGTSGDMEKVKESREMFTHPDVYDIVMYDDVWENSGKIGFFIPSYYAELEYKDENGNTLLEEAIAAYQERREKKRKSKDSTQYEAELMNYPLKPSEMFLSRKGNILPVGELTEWRRDLLNDRYSSSNQVIGELFFSDKHNRGVRFEPDLSLGLKPILVYPTPKNQDTEGALIVYEKPIEDVSGNVPEGLYIIGHDPVKTDEDGLSFASIHVLKTPKYFKQYGGNQLVASYIGRPSLGRKETNELIEKLAMWYGNHNRMIYFENAVGNVKEYFEKRKKLNLLATQPQTILNKKQGQTTTNVIYGYPMSNKIIKEESIKYLKDWLLEERGEVDDKKLLNLHMIRDTRLLEEMIAFDFNGNFDSVMGFTGCIIGLEETYNRYKQETHKQEEDILDFLNKSLQTKYAKLSQTT